RRLLAKHPVALRLRSGPSAKRSGHAAVFTSVSHGRRRWFTETDFAQIVYLALDLQPDLKV
ncbi:MAG: hypothetical protein KAT23_07835, partial [Anaerolineales bacterium]|nr:hypothetical protein [Anaerolineales bacterium]